jgi:hypothetical protein
MLLNDRTIHLTARITYWTYFIFNIFFFVIFDSVRLCLFKNSILKSEFVVSYDNLSPSKYFPKHLTYVKVFCIYDSNKTSYSYYYCQQTA